MLLRTVRKKKLLWKSNFLRLVKLPKKDVVIQLKQVQTSFRTCLMLLSSDLMPSEQAEIKSDFLKCFLILRENMSVPINLCLIKGTKSS